MNVLSFITITLFSAQTALALDLPTGEFKYSNTQAISTKHVHRLYQRSSKEKEMIATYRASGYLCKRQNSAFTDCSKNIETNPNQTEFKSKKFISLAPTFSENVRGVEELSDGESVTVYQITQDNFLNEIQNTNYKAYDIKDGAFYVDLDVDNFAQVRFEFAGPRVLTRFSFQKEKISKREHYLHGLISYYIK